MPFRAVFHSILESDTRYVSANDNNAILNEFGRIKSLLTHYLEDALI